MNPITIGRVAATAVEAALEPRPALTQHEAAQYVEQMCSGLADIADRSGLGFLAYLLEVAREEALLHSTKENTPMQRNFPPL